MTSTETQSARDDLAFIKALVGDDETVQMRTFGETYFGAGLVYGGQMILHALQAHGLLPWTPLWSLGIGVGPTLLFLPIVGLIVYRNRKYPVRGPVGRAVANLFGVTGIANLAMIVVIGWVALKQHSIQTWLLYACCVFVFQGTAWLFSYMMRRRGWYLAVAIGWFATAVACAIAIPTSLNLFILFAGLGLWGCMALPGWLVMRSTRRAA
jgi:hypothetical protein